jgi:hypothetical protein
LGAGIGERHQRVRAQPHFIRPLDISVPEEPACRPGVETFNHLSPAPVMPGLPAATLVSSAPAAVLTFGHHWSCAPITRLVSERRDCVERPRRSHFQCADDRAWA